MTCTMSRGINLYYLSLPHCISDSVLAELLYNSGRFVSWVINFVHYKEIVFILLKEFIVLCTLIMH